MNLWTLSDNFRSWNDHLTILYRTGSWGSLSKIDLNYRKNSKQWFKLLETLFQWAHFSFQFLSCLHSSESKELTIFGMKLYDRLWRTSTKDRKWGKNITLEIVPSIDIPDFWLIWVQKTTKYTKFHSRELDDCTFYPWNDILASIQFFEWSKWHLLDEQSAICSW